MIKKIVSISNFQISEFNKFRHFKILLKKKKNSFTKSNQFKNLLLKNQFIQFLEQLVPRKSC